MRNFSRATKWIIPLLVVIGFKIPATIEGYTNQIPGVFKLPTGYIQLGWGILLILFVCGLWFCIWNMLNFRKDEQSKVKGNWWQQSLIVMLGFVALVFAFIQVTPLRIFLLSWVSPLVMLGWVLIVRAVLSQTWASLFKKITHNDFVLAFIFWILLKALLEFKLAMPLDNTWRVYFYVAVLFQSILVASIWHGFEKPSLFFQLTNKENRNTATLIVAITVSFFIPVLLYWLDTLNITQGIVLRAELILLGALLLTFGAGKWNIRWGVGNVLILAITWMGFLLMAGSYLSRVTTYPFSLSWSEGNRFYDYSLIFGSHLYRADGIIKPNYFSPGRYGLWGLPFLIDGLPIAIHRLWNAILYTIPGLILGWLMGRKFQNPIFRWITVFGTALFFNQGPVYPTLTISLIILILSNSLSPRWRYLLIIAASLFAGLSRFTWVLAIAACSGMADLLVFYPTRGGSWYQRLMPTGISIIAGLIPGALVSWGEVFATQGEMISSQPLLWYRLLPNSTYSFGILLGALIASGTMLTVTIWQVLSKKSQLDLWQKTGALLTILGLFIAGIVASTKIGGGSNLHNLDMYFAILLLVFCLLLSRTATQNSFQLKFPQLILIVISIIIPVFSVTWSGGPLILPKVATIDQTLEKITSEVAKRKVNGEILFLDQRQLLTFGEITDVKLIPEYEKKFMMDQAMAGNDQYFKTFYDDLENKRFELIISGPLNLNEQTDIHDFSEENNAWVRFVSRPVLENYQSIFLDKKNNIELFIPVE